MSFQRVGDDVLNRADHIWYYRPADDKWKCVTCGEVVEAPYSAKPDDGVVPQAIELLTAEERAMAPFKGEQ